RLVTKLVSRMGSEMWDVDNSSIERDEKGI
ncbi:unnamed protein product, partial [marine sediment metagenome]